ncbi:hypothetical protein [Streptomyces sp. NPDC059893]|uniref:hypothetical protein n=1 Tax=Streptomyces sp. NPDC059893 TaxID=3346990 RepID=UPI0036686130
MSIDLSTVTTWIGAHATEADTDRIMEVIVERRKTLAQMAAASIVVGMDVEVVNLSPAAYKGQRGTVTAIKGKYATVKFTKQSTVNLRFARSARIRVPSGVEQFESYGIPLQCLRQV